MPSVSRHRERGQAAVELIAVVPLIALLVIGVVQGLVALHLWSAAHEAARAGARADLVGAPVEEAVRGAMMGAASRRATIRTSTGPDGTRDVRVVLSMPGLVPWIPAGSVGSSTKAMP